MKPIIFLRTAWMINYEGVTDTDKPNGAGSYVKENQDGGEVANFFPVDSKYYGYARIRKGNDLRIQRLGAEDNDEYIDDVTIVFFATNPNIGGQYVVGWYDNAILYRAVQYLNKNQRKGHPQHIAVTGKRKGTLLPVQFRKFPIPDDGPGQTNAWYVSEYAKADSFLKKFYEFKRNPFGYKGRKQGGGNTGGKGWQLDAEKRKRIEIAAMNATAEYFEIKDFKVLYVHNEKLGWDLEAQKGKAKLLLEVKGTSSSLDTVLLTPNEYLNSKQKANYRICILENALNVKKAKLHICKITSDESRWISESGEQLKINEIRSAQLKKIEN